LPAFITGGGAPQPQANGDGEQGERGDRNDRFGRRRRRFRPRGPNDHADRGEPAGDMSVAGGDAAPKSE
jgi:hypothetical protein